MRYQLWIVSCAMWTLIANVPNAGAMTLQEAMQMAAKNHPQTHMANLRVEAASGKASDLRAYAYNPELTLEPQRRTLAGGGRTNDYYITLSQGIEIGGKQGYRQAAAEADIGIANAGKQLAEQRLMATAAAAYVNLFYAQKAKTLAKQISELYRQLTQGMLRRLDAGEASKLDVNLVQSAYASSLNAAVTAEQTFNLRQQEYFSAVGSSETGTLQLPPLPTAWQPASNYVDLAWESRPDLQVLRHRVDQMESLANLASANRIPDVTISASAGREAGDRLVKVGITVPFPVLNNHQGAYRAALAEEELSRTDVAWAKQQLRYDIESALSSHTVSTRAALAIEASSILKDSDEAIRLARVAFDAGELEPEEMVIRIKQAADTRLSSMETLRQAWLARIRLAEVIGHPEIIIKGTNHE